MDHDLLGYPVDDGIKLIDKYVEPPFSVIDARSKRWHNRKRRYLKLGLNGELGRSSTALGNSLECNNLSTGCKNYAPNLSVFDPVLCEIIYRWFCPDHGTILDPFAGGSTRGFVANYLGYNYTGVDIRAEQIESNINQVKLILDSDNMPRWICGDSLNVLDTMTDTFDFVFSCPPYGSLEKYSDLKGDISNMTYDLFIDAYCKIVSKSIRLLKRGAFACFVVSDFRDKKSGAYLGFVKDTIQSFIDSGADLWNEIILLNALGTAAMRSDKCMSSSKKVVRVHQHILVFKKRKL